MPNINESIKQATYLSVTKKQTTYNAEKNTPLTVHQQERLLHGMYARDNVRQ